MNEYQPTLQSVLGRLLFNLAVVLCGCAGSWALVDPEMSQKNQGRVVEAVEMNDGRVVVFDAFESAGPGPDTRARLYGESIQGTFAGAPRIVSLKDVKKVQFGVEEKAAARKASPYLIGGVVFVALLVPILYLIAMTNVDMR